MLYPAIAEAARRAGAGAVGLIDVECSAGLGLLVARIGIDRAPLDVSDPDDARWLRACVAPDETERLGRLEAALALATASPPLLLAGDAVEVLPDAVARVPANALPVVTTTWALSHLAPEGRLRFLQRLDEAARGRPVAWVSAEGVGRCWSQGRWLAWLAGA